MKISKEYLKKVITEEINEVVRPAPFDPVPPKHMRSKEDDYEGFEDDFNSKKQDEEWLYLVANDYAQEPGNLEKIIAIAKKDPRRARSLGKYTRSIDGKIVTLGSEKLGKMVSSGVFGREAREIAKAEIEKWSQGKVGRAQNIKKRTGSADLSDIGAPVAQIRESELKKIIMQEIKSSLEQSTGTGYDDVRGGMESEPQPEDFAQDTDGSGVLFKLGDGTYKVVDDRGQDHQAQNIDQAMYLMKKFYK
jgi:hypothetical protein